jgi:hypothetical protein
MQNQDDGIFANNFELDGSRIPPFFAYQTYPALEDAMFPPYTQPYCPISNSGDWMRADIDYLAPIPVTLPSMMLFHDTVKRKYEGNDIRRGRTTPVSNDGSSVC